MPTNDPSSETLDTPALKKPYEKPSFRHEQVFVTTALSCGKVDPTFSLACATNQKVS